MTENNLKKENEALKAQLNALSTLNPALYTGANSDTDDEIDLRELWNAIWSGKWLIIAITFVFAVASIFYALSLPNQYKSTAILIPASTSSSSGLSKLAGQFGGLASMAGISLGGAGSENKAVVGKELLKTWGFLEEFVRKNNIEVEVMAAVGWNRAENQLIIDTTVYDQNTKKWTRKYNPAVGQELEPNGWELYNKIKNLINISEDKNTGLIELSVEHYSPHIAKQWTDKLVKSINAFLQLQDRKSVAANIDYLKKQIELTPVAEMRAVFYQLIEEQTKTQMLAEASDEYVFKTVSEAKISYMKSKPQRPLIVIMGTMLGGIFSIFIALLFYFNVTKQKKQN